MFLLFGLLGGAAAELWMELNYGQKSNKGLDEREDGGRKISSTVAGIQEQQKEEEMKGWSEGARGNVEVLVGGRGGIMKSSGPVQEKPQPGCVQMVACRDAQLAFISGKAFFPFRFENSLQ